MKRLALVLAATFALTVPASAQTLTVLLPTISFPDAVVTPSTMGCDATVKAPTCQLQE